MSQIDDRVHLTTTEAIAMLPDGPTVHTFRGNGVILIGADWPREDIVAAIEKHGCELTGPIATKGGHGMALRDEHGIVWVATKGSVRHVHDDDEILENRS